MIHSSRSMQWVPMSSKRAAVADGRVLAPGTGDGRIPTGELRAAHDHLAQGARLHQFAHLLVIDILAHAPGEHEFHPGLGAGGFHLVHLGHADGDGLLAEDVFAGLGGLHGLAAFRSYLALRLLRQNGWPDVRSLSGGLSTLQLELPALALDQDKPAAELTGTGR